MIADPGVHVDRRQQERDTHLDDVVRAMKTGRLVVFLGAGANMCSRTPDLVWTAEQREHLPLGGELAQHLAREFKYPKDGKDGKEIDLARVAQWIALSKGTGPLYDELHKLFDQNYPTTDLHRFLATLPSRLRSKGYPRISDSTSRRFLVVTTNYDDLLERTFSDAGKPAHVVVYQSERKSGHWESRGNFFHRSPGETRTQRIDRPNKYENLLADEEPIILKIHGAVDRERPDGDSFVITEDHYLDYLEFAPTALASLIPGPLPALLAKSHLLFLGYALKDWNLRVILRRLWRDRTRTFKHWSIQHQVDPHENTFWQTSGVEILDWPLGEYVMALRERVEAILGLSVTPSA